MTIKSNILLKRVDLFEVICYNKCKYTKEGDKKVEQLMSLSKLFTEKLYRIPDYQRGYAWGRKEAEDLWNDLRRLGNDKKYYVGVITLEKVKPNVYNEWLDDVWIIKSKSYEPYYVVDGQQRLTTSIILVQCILEEMEKRQINNLNYDTVDDIRKKYIYQSKPENCSKSFLFSYETGNPSLDFWTMEILSNSNDANNFREMTMYTSNLLDIKKYYGEKLGELDNENLELIYTKLTQSFLFNIYEISDDIDVFVAFESMNNRGKRLSTLELLKNRLIYLSTLFNVEEDIKTRLRLYINNCWKTLYTQLGLNPNNPLSDDEFLFAHYVIHFPEIYFEEYKKLNVSIRKYDNIDFSKLRSNYLLNHYFVPERIENGELNTTDIFTYINSLSKSIKKWSMIRNPGYSGWNDDIKNLLLKINYFYFERYSLVEHPNELTLLLYLLQNENNQIKVKKLLKYIERFNYIKLFYPRECIADNLEDFDEEDLIYKACKDKICIDLIIEKYEKKCAEIVNSTNAYSRLLRYYHKNTFYNNRRVVFYTLCEYEIKLMKESKSGKRVDNALLGDKNYATIEHIYPKKSTCKYWKDLYADFSTQQKNKLKNSLGNFVLVSELKNEKLANKSFPEKKENCDNVVGYKYGSYSEVELCKNEDWGATEILARGVKLLLFINEHWGLNIKKQDFTKVLGLDFVKKA